MKIRLISLIAASALLMVACGGGDGVEQAEASSADLTTTSQQSQSTDPVTTATTAAVATTEPTTSGELAAGLTSTVSDGWSAVAVGEGTKPDLALDGAGVPGIAFLFETLPEGFVAFASAADAWDVDVVVEGYFYGPIGLDFDLDDRPNIAYHDHQASSFSQELGDLTHARLDGDQWTVTAAESVGHDGWDSTIRVGPDGVVRAAGVDPSQFGSPDGVEYYELVGDEWTVEAIGSGPIAYEWNVDLQVTADGAPGVTYFRTETQDLIYSVRSGGTWTADVVDEDGDVGRFSSFAYDSDGGVHISYWNADLGEVRYASNSTGEWVTEKVGLLDDVQIGFEGARRITSLDIAPDGLVQVVFSDVSGIWLAVRDADATWSTTQVVSAGARPLGQLVSFEIDAAGLQHLAFFEVTGNSPLSGVVAYVSPAS